jgi:hypothetical protein
MSAAGASPLSAGSPVRARAEGAALAMTALMVAAGLGAAVAAAPTLAVLGAVALALATVIVVRPSVAGYLVIGLTPLVVGIDRGRILPVVRPNEALLLLCGGSLLVRALWNLRSGVRFRPRPGPVVTALLLMAVFNSIVPLLWMSVRAVPVSVDDLLYAVVLWKYLALYGIVRAAVRSEREVRRCLWLAMAAASVVAVVAVLQSLGLFGVPRLLGSFYAPFGDENRLSNGRGGSTLALPAATADLMIFNIALVAGFWRRTGFRPHPALVPMAVLFVVGTLASGQFSGAIGLVVAMVLIGLVSRRANLPIAFGLVGLAATWLLRPVIEHRLSGFDSVSGLPESWVGRLHNLRSYFWPTLFSDGNYVLGVRPAARVPGSRELAVRWVWIESGYTWLLWGGGIPLLVSYLAFVAVSVRRSWRMAQRPDAFGTAATGVLVGVVVVAVLMLFDPHLTYRGAADLLFALLALTAVRGVESSPIPDETARIPPTATRAAGRSFSVTGTGGGRHAT